ncbi:hypothetical protein PEPTYR26121_00830 [Peptoniphilus tyrrelliae]|nr:hypothetical protein PEPTYR26121_00830 [Peptoniphilus tyrrelliae]
MFRYFLTDKYTILYFILQIMYLLAMYKSFKKGYEKSAIVFMLILIIFNYLYLSINYVVRW